MNKEEVQKALNTIGALGNELEEILRETQTTGDTTAGLEKIKRWKTRAIRNLSQEISPAEAEALSHKNLGSFQLGNPIGNFERLVNIYSSFLIALGEEVENHPEDILNRPVPVISDEIVVFDRPTGKAVFIVHGHDELNLYKLKELLRDRYKLEPVVLSGEPGKGRTLIEKFEAEAQRAAFAFVIFTPDDAVKKGSTEYSQARPNVIFEIGWFYGRLGRDKVCILFKKGTKIHSDLDGVSRIEFAEFVTEKIDEIERELISGKMLTART